MVLKHFKAEIYIRIYILALRRFALRNIYSKRKKGKAIPVTGLAGP
jgi:hypothetical protein